MTQLMNRDQAAEFLGVSKWTLTRMVARDEFPPPFTIGRQRHFWLREDVEAWVRAERDRQAAA